jgi:oligosaccharide reducing-end xylanase
MTGNQIMRPSLAVKLGAASLLILSGCVLLAQQPPANGSGAFATGQYRNLFVEAGHSQAEVTKKVNAVFQQLFYGDARTQAVYYPAGINANGALAYIYDTGNRDVRSEGMSYGMMIAVQLNKKTEFDAMWNWARTYMYHDSPTNPAYGFFSWSMKTNSTPNDEISAPDGEEYFTTALYFASDRWGNGPGIYNYRAEADRLLTNMEHRDWIAGRTRNGTKTVGAIFDLERHMVRLTPDKKNCDHTDPSYHLPAFYELWAKWGPKADRSFWEQTAATSRDFFQRIANPRTGLTPDFAEFDGTPWAAAWNRPSTNFMFDAWRTAMNWSVDWAWWAKDPRECHLSNRLQAFFASQGMTNYVNQYTLDGKPLSTPSTAHSPGLVAINAVAGLAATQPLAHDFVEELWNTPVPAGQWRYYDGLLYFMGLLHCSGEFRIWPPQTNVPSPSS